MFKAVWDLCDAVSVACFCPGDNTLLLSLEGVTSEYWLPSVKVPPGESWSHQVSNEILKDIFGGPMQFNRILRTEKFWMPNHKYPYLNHTVFEIIVNADQKKKSRSALGKYRGKTKWVTEDDLHRLQISNNIKSPDLMEFFESSKYKNQSPMPSNFPAEYSLMGNFVELTEDVIISGKSTIFEQIVEAAGLDHSSQEVLYREFVLMCYPALFMSVQVFSRYLTEVGWSKEEVPHLFRAADMHNRLAVSYREFIYFLASVEPGTTHGGGPAELRCRYIFRYLDYRKSNALKRDEMRNLVVLVRRNKKQPLDPPKVDQDLAECYRSMGFPENHELSMSEFLRAVGELKVRGTSQIYRAPNSVHRYVKACQERDNRLRFDESVGGGGAVGPSRRGSYTKGIEFELAAHSVKIQKSGTTINIDQLWTLENAMSFSSTKEPLLSEASRRQSMDHFNQKSSSNELLRALRYLFQNNSNKKQCYIKLEQLNFSWGNLESSAIAKLIMAVCASAKDIFMKEARLLDVRSPVYIMGDLHGNISDVLNFERVLWPLGPVLCPCSLLFLGDFVDRGLYSVEVISYLFAYKLQTPTKLWMLRGNHEIKRVQQQWTFEKECKLKFGEKIGLLVFTAINDVFDVMPLAATIEGRVFCCHGGIPPPWLCPIATAINDIPVILNDPQTQSSLAWELMWNDPVRTKSITEKLAMELLANEGFAMNSRRGTAHIFSMEALDKFLMANGFTHLVRAHEVAEIGFTVQQKGKMITVFSSSKYCSGKNAAACILADHGKLRMLRLDSEN